MGLIYKDSGLFQEALEEYKLAITHGPPDCPAKENMAVVLTVRHALSSSLKRGIF